MRQLTLYTVVVYDHVQKKTRACESFCKERYANAYAHDVALVVPHYMTIQQFEHNVCLDASCDAYPVLDACVEQALKDLSSNVRNGQ